VLGRGFVHRLVHPEAYASSVKEAAAEHGVDPMLVWSIMRSESHYREDALSPVGARGLMQLMPATARRIGRMKAAARPHSARFVEPESNVWLGTWYLAQLAERYRGFRPAQIGAYNAGPTPMERWLDELDGRPTDEFIERISYRETRRYTRRVLETLWTYELLYGQPRTELNPTVSRKPPPEDAVAF
jgi:soluble lytic murein transglycosylase